MKNAPTHGVYGKLRLYKPAQNWPAKPAIEITNNDKIGKLEHKQQSAMMIMQFVIWREWCARSFTDKHKQIEELMEEIKWHLRLYEKSRLQASGRCGT